MEIPKQYSPLSVENKWLPAVYNFLGLCGEKNIG
jgi:hypothetical protein